MSETPATNLTLPDPDESACLVLGDLVTVAPSLDSPGRVLVRVEEAESGRHVWMYFDRSVALEIYRQLGTVLDEEMPAAGDRAVRS